MPPATPKDPNNPMAGSWRFQGNDRYGAYGGFITFTPDQMGNYIYQRIIDSGAGNRPDKGDRGKAELTGAHLHTVENPMAGVAAGLNLNQITGQPQRIKHGFYRMDSRFDSGQGFYFKSHLERGTEQLRRMGANASNNHVQLLIDGNEAFPMMRAELMQAKRSINVQFFIFVTDDTGVWFAKLLAQKAREGVQVRVLLDDYGSFIHDTIMNEFAASGVEVIFQHDRNTGFKNTLKDIGKSIITLGGLFGGKRDKGKRGLFNHDHRKIITIDGRVGFTGGMNIMGLYEHDWHDIHARVEGNVVKEMEALFWEGWTEAGGTATPVAPDPRTQDPRWWPGNMNVELVDSVPGVHTDIKDRYLSEIAVSRKRILIENAYFLNDDVINALRRKASSGVSTTVIIPKDELNDVAIITQAFKWIRNDILRSGVLLYTYRDRMTHGKVAAFDGVVSTVGSCNLDDLALEKLYEANLFIQDAPFTQLMEDRVFRVDIPKSDLEQIKKQKFWDKLKSGALWFFRGFM
jgi:cardiolipin synthase